MSLREQNKQRTRRALGDAAITLFTEHGYDAVTMADVAALAGVSRRTAFRYFASKDELVMEHPAEWMAVFDEAVAAHQHLPTGERLRLASHAIVAHIERDPDPVRQLLALTFAHPTLTARYAASSHGWTARVAAELAGSTPEAEARQTADVSLEDKILAAAFMGMINAVCETWAAADEPMGPMIDLGFDAFAGAFDR